MRIIFNINRKFMYKWLIKSIAPYLNEFNEYIGDKRISYQEAKDE